MTKILETACDPLQIWATPLPQSRPIYFPCASHASNNFKNQTNEIHIERPTENNLKKRGDDIQNKPVHKLRSCAGPKTIKKYMNKQQTP